MPTIIPEIEIRFESLQYTADELLRVLDKRGFVNQEITHNIIKVVRQCLKNNFMQAFEDLGYILNDFANQKMVIVVHQFQSKENENVLAYFNIYATSSATDGYYFGVYAPVILDYILSETYWPEKDFLNTSGVWQHELIHMADYKKLKEFRQNCDKCRKNESVLNHPFAYKQIDVQDNSKPWKMMSVLSGFRDEGIPVLYEVLSGLRVPAVKNLDMAINWFKMMFEPLKQMLNYQSLSHSQVNYYNDTLKEIHANCYLVGPWFVLNALQNSNNQQMAANAIKVLKQGTASLSKDESLQLINYALSLDIGSYLFFDSIIDRSIGSKTFFDIDDLIGFCSTFSDKVDNLVVNNFLKNIMQLAANKDTEGFMQAILEIIGYPMDEAEIDEEFLKYSNSVNCEFCIENEVFIKTKQIYETWKKTEDPILQTVLTYILDPEDLLDDSIKYMGYIDDLYVLIACEKLVKKDGF